jgi:hypothetical protein
MAGGVYTVNKLNKLEVENKQLNEELAKQSEDAEQTSTSTSTTTSPAQNNREQSDQESSRESEETDDSTYTSVSQPSFNTQTQANIDTTVYTADEEEDSQTKNVEELSPEETTDSTSSIEAEIEPTVTFNTQYITQEIDSSASSSIGNFEISINVSASGGDVFIPMTTNDSTFGEDTDVNKLRAKGDEPEPNLVGFQYGIGGDNFRGEQDSEVSCSLRNDDRCKITSGESANVTLEITIEPNETGNYFIELDRITYIQNDETKTYNYEESTGTIYLKWAAKEMDEFGETLQVPGEFLHRKVLTPSTGSATKP